MDKLTKAIARAICEEYYGCPDELVVTFPIDEDGEMRRKDVPRLETTDAHGQAQTALQAIKDSGYAVVPEKEMHLPLDDIGLEVEDALRSEGIYCWGAEGERFERMFEVVMKTRRTGQYAAAQEEG